MNSSTHSRPWPAPVIKVCGLTNSADAQEAIDAGANLLGFVVVPESPRGISAAKVWEILQELPAQIPSVLVTTQGDPGELHNTVRDAGVSHLQLCGKAQAEDFRDFSLPILRRIPVEAAARAEMEDWSQSAHAFVLDHPSAPGGTGQTVDLSLAAELASDFPCLLAGGLHSANVAEAVQKVQPMGVDASSKLESAPGRKDHEEVRRFVYNARIALEVLP